MVEPGALQDRTRVSQDALLCGAFPGGQIASARSAGRALSQQVELADIAIDAAGTGGHG
jgi:hypothetical protein